MKTNICGRAFPGLVVAAALIFGAGGASAAEAPADRVLQIDRYTSERGKTLGQRYQGTLKSLNVKVYHCMPWLDVKTEGIGFYKPKHLEGVIRYLSLNVVVDQQPSPEFSRLAVQDRVSSMFSRYVPHLLRSLATPDLVNEPLVEGFTVIVSWLKIEPAAGQPPVFETAATKGTEVPVDIPPSTIGWVIPKRSHTGV